MRPSTQGPLFWPADIGCAGPRSVGRLDADDALETAAAWERLVAHAQAQQFRALARFASLRQAPDWMSLPPTRSPQYCTFPAALRVRGWTSPPDCPRSCPTRWPNCRPGRSTCQRHARSVRPPKCSTRRPPQPCSRGYFPRPRPRPSGNSAPRCPGRSGRRPRCR